MPPWLLVDTQPDTLDTRVTRDTPVTCVTRDTRIPMGTGKENDAPACSVTAGWAHGINKSSRPSQYLLALPSTAPTAYFLENVRKCSARGWNLTVRGAPNGAGATAHFHCVALRGAFTHGGEVTFWI